MTLPSTKQALIIALALTCNACGARVIGQLSPQPTAVVPDGKYALVLDQNVKDVHKFPRTAVVKDFRATMSSAFHNMMGARATTNPSDEPLTLVIEHCELRLEQAGVTSYLVASVRGRWLNAAQQEIIQFAGKVQAPNPMSNGPAQVTGIVESIYESIMKEFNDELNDRHRSHQEQSAENNTALRYY